METLSGSRTETDEAAAPTLVGDDLVVVRPQRLDEELPPLYGRGARTIARDRWERIVSSHRIGASPEAIWSALTDPARVAQWFFACNGSLLDKGVDCVLDFGDGDFFLARPIEVDPPHYLEWRWRWLGIGPAWSVKWYLEGCEDGTRVVVADEALNPPARTGHYRGEGWPEILGNLATYLRTGMGTRWVSRSQSYVLIDVPGTLYAAWDRLFDPRALKWWLHGFHGEIAPGSSVSIHMGDASGSVELAVEEVVEPSYNVYPAVRFLMKKPRWPMGVPGRLFLEPAGWGRSVLQVFQTDWENLGPALHPSERAVIVSFWAEAFRRAEQLCSSESIPGRASPWVMSEAAEPEEARYRLSPFAMRRDEDEVPVTRGE
jgi:uncharacterized protein YndB with AHSA1/START domain